MICAEGVQSKGAKKVEGKGKSKDAMAAKAPNAHAPAPAANASAKDTKKSSSWLPSVLALPGTGKAARTPSGVYPCQPLLPTCMHRPREAAV